MEELTAGATMPPPALTPTKSGKVTVPRWMILVGALAAQILFTLAMAEAPVLGLAQAAALLAVGMYGVLKRDLTIIICVIAYTTGCEVLWRQIRVPMFWMGASYLVTMLSAFAVLFVLQRLGKSARIALLYLALLLPAMIATIRTTGENAREIIAFALAGPAALAAFAAFTSQVNVQPWLYRRILWITVISAVGPLTFAIQTLLGDLAGGGLSFDNQSNFSASGGFGPVQVSSLLSLGVMAALLLIIIETSLAVRILAGLVTVVLAVQTLLTFSRGGSFSVGIAMTALGIYQAKNRRVRNTIIAVAIVAFTLASLVVFPWLDGFTGGAFEERFSDTQTGRTELATNDTQIFADNIVLGVGAGMTKYQRLTYEICELRSDKCIDEVSSHTEFTRMLSEHGLPGVIGLVLFALLTWQALRRPGPGQGFAIAWVAWALSQMVYANLRVVAVPFAFGLAFLRFCEPRPAPSEHDDHSEWQPPSPERFVGPSGTHAVALSANTQHPQLSSGLPTWDPATGRMIEPAPPTAGSTEGPLSPDSGAAATPRGYRAAAARPVTAAVVVGSGSAGRRHAAALLTRAPGRRVVMVRRPGSTTPVEPLDALGVELVPRLQDALGAAPTLAVIASPAPWHAAAATDLLDAGCHVLVEKPVVASLDTPTTHRLLAHPHVRRRLLVGYHLRFTELLAQVVTWIGQGRIGTPTAGELVVGQHLGSWRPGTEPHQGVSARAELGGGVLLELSHELDIARVLFDAPVAAVERCELRHDGAPTDGTVETVADLALHMGSGPSCRIRLDMTSQTPVRRWTIEGTEGTVVADVLTSRLSLRRHDGTVDDRSIPSGDRDHAETRLIAHLEDMAANGVAPRCDIDDGLAAVAVVDAARRSAAQAGPVEVAPLDRSAA